MNSEAENYGVGDCSYRAAGELPGITRLVDAFYRHMETLPEAKVVLDMHPANLELSRKKLTYFLSGWLGGPRLYSEHFGSISIPSVHRHLQVDGAAKNAWMLCMKKAVSEQSYKPAFQRYLIEQLAIPAERVRQACAASQP